MFVLRTTLSLALLAAVTPLAATAQQVPVDPSQGFQPADFQVRVMKPDGDGWAFITTDVEKERYFNRARCECQAPIRIRADLSMAGLAKGRAAVTKGNFEIVVGANECVATNSNDFNNRKCTSLGKGRLADLAATGTDADTDVSKLFAAPNITNGASCAIQAPQTVWLLLDFDEDMRPDMGLGDSSAPKLSVYLDGQAPPAPTKVTVTPGNEALNVTWNSDALIDDKSGYVVFCSRAGLRVFEETFYTGDEFYTRQKLCGDKIVRAQTQQPDAGAGRPDAGVATEIVAPDEFADLNTDYVCSDLITTSNEWRIRVLQNEIKYMVGVAAVDIRGNASPITTAYVQAPVPTKDFYRGYRDAGGEASGCAYGSGAAPGGLALAALAAVAVVRARRRR